MPSKRKKMRQEKQKKREGEKVKSKSQDCCVTFKPKSWNFAFCACPNFANWYSASGTEGREVYVWPVNGFVVSFSSLWHNRQMSPKEAATLTARKISKHTLWLVLSKTSLLASLKGSTVSQAAQTLWLSTSQLPWVTFAASLNPHFGQEANSFL